MRKNLTASSFALAFMMRPNFCSRPVYAARNVASMVSVKSASILLPTVYFESRGKLLRYWCHSLYASVNLRRMGRSVGGNPWGGGSA